MKTYLNTVFITLLMLIYDQGLSQSRRPLTVIDVRNEVECYHKEAKSLWKIGKFDSAFKMAELSVELLKTQDNIDYQLLNRSYNYLSYICGKQNRILSRIKYCDSAIIALHHLDSLTEDLVYGYWSRAKQYQRLGDIYGAMESYKDMLPAAKKLNYKYHESLHDLADAYNTIGELEKAKNLYLLIINDPAVEDRKLFSRSVDVLVSMYIQQDSLTKARSLFQKFKRELNEVFDKNTNENKCIFFKLEASFLFDDNKNLAALEAINLALQYLFEDKREYYKLLCTEKHKILLSLNEYEEAIRIAKEALLEINELKNDDHIDPYEIVSTHLISETYVQLFQRDNNKSYLDSALVYCTKVKELSQQFRKGMVESESKQFLSHYLKENNEIGTYISYQLYVLNNTLVSLNNFYSFLQYGKNQALLDEIFQKIVIEKDSKTQLNKLNDLLFRKNQMKDPNKIREINVEIFQVRNEVKNLLGKSYENLLSSMSLEELKAISKVGNKSILEFGESTDHFYTLLIEGEKVEVRRLNMAKDSLLHLISTHNNNLRNVHCTPQTYASSAFKIYSEILNGLNLTNREIIVIPTPSLSNVNFESLVTKSKHENSNYKTLTYAIYKNRFSYQLSSQLLSNTTSANTINQVALISSSSEKEGNLSNQLNYIEEGLSTINGRILKDTDIPSLDALYKHYSLIHFVSHGHYQSNDSVSNVINISLGEKDVLTLSDIYYSNNENHPFIILNTCESGLGKLLSGEGVNNFTRAFIYGGASGVIESSWKVNATSSLKIFNHFYHFLKKGVSSTEALNKSLLDYLSSQDIDQHLAHPYYWSGFKHYGSTISKNNKESKYLLISLFGGFILICLFALMRKRYY